ILTAPFAIFLDQFAVRESRLGILIKHPHVGMGRSAIEVKVIFLYVLPMISLRIGQSEEPLFEDGIFSIPERQRETQCHVVVGDPRDAILSPAIRARARVVVCKVIPGVSVRTVILANCPPLSLTQIRAPLAPRYLFLASFPQSQMFGCFVFHSPADRACPKVSEVFSEAAFRFFIG